MIGRCADFQCNFNLIPAFLCVLENPRQPPLASLTWPHYLLSESMGACVRSEDDGYIRASNPPATAGCSQDSSLPPSHPALTHVHDSVVSLFLSPVVCQLSMAIYIPYSVDTSPSHSPIRTLSPSPALALTSHVSEVQDAILAQGHLKRPISFLEDTPHDLCTTIPGSLKLYFLHFILTVRLALIQPFGKSVMPPKKRRRQTSIDPCSPINFPEIRGADLRL